MFCYHVMLSYDVIMGHDNTPPILFFLKTSQTHNKSLLLSIQSSLVSTIKKGGRSEQGQKVLTWRAEHPERFSAQRENFAGGFR
jgi:hypothetical protein